MERVWRKVNQGLTLRSSSSKVATGSGAGAGAGGGTGGTHAPPSGAPTAVPVAGSSATGAAAGFPHSTDTTSSAGFGESQVVAVQRRRSVVPQASTASSEKRRRRRRRSRPSREGTSQAGHSSGGHHKGHSSSGRRTNNAQSVTIAQQSNEQSLRQRAVARLKMFNFNLNWDLHMTQCKPCGPKSGNIITRRLCRNRRGEDNELYRSNSFKFERFERKDPMETGTRTMLRKQV